MGLLDSVAAQARPREQRDDRNDKRGARTAQEAKPKDTYFREDYGWVMSDAQVRKEQEVQAAYADRDGRARSAVDSASSRYQSEIINGRSGLEGQYDEAINAASSAGEKLYPVRVVNGDNIEGTYMLPKSAIDQMNTETFNQDADGGYTGNWVDDGQNYNVDVRARGVGPRGQELHDALRVPAQSYQDQIKLQGQAVDNLKNERDTAISGYNATAAESLSGARSTWDAELASMSTYGERVAGGRAKYAESKKKLSDSIVNQNMGLLQSPTNGVRV